MLLRLAWLGVDLGLQLGPPNIVPVEEFSMTVCPTQVLKFSRAFPGR